MSTIIWLVVIVVVLAILAFFGWRGSQKNQKIVALIVFGLFLSVPYFLIFYVSSFSFGPLRSPELSLNDNFSKNIAIGIGLVLFVLWLTFAIQVLRKKQ